MKLKSVITLIVAFLIEVWLVHAQQTPLRGSYIIETLSADIDPQSIAVGPAGEIYVGSRDRIYRSDDGKTFMAIAGLAHPPEFCCVDPAPRPTFFSGDGGPALQAYIDGPNGIIVDYDRTIYFADSLNHLVRSISPNGTIDTVVGNGRKGFGGDGGPARAAMLYYPAGLAIDKQGNLFIADMDNNRVRRVDRSGIITTVAGNGKEGSGGDGRDARKARLRPNGVFVDNAGAIFIADAANGRVRRVEPNGVVHTIAGRGRRGESGGSGLAVRAQLFGPESLVVDESGNVFFTDILRIRRISSDGTISTIGGNGKVEDIASLRGNCKMATDVPIFSKAVAIAPDGRLYINDRSRLRVLIPKGQK